jgi:chorismate synthase
MGRLLFKVAGESHGPALIALLSALPAGLKYPESLVKNWLRLRRTVAGRGPRSGTETDQVEIISGFTDGKANGGPVSLLIRNQDSGGRSSTPEGHNQSLEFPRPGHADFAGAKKWGLTDASVVAELASARLTAAYTASGALAQGLLETVGISTLACVTRLGPIKLRPENWVTGSDLSGAIRKADQSRFLALDQGREEAMTQALSQAETQGDTLGGEFAVVVAPLPAGLGISQPL